MGQVQVSAGIRTIDRQGIVDALDADFGEKALGVDYVLAYIKRVDEYNDFVTSTAKMIEGVTEEDKAKQMSAMLRRDAGDRYTKIKQDWLGVTMSLSRGLPQKMDNVVARENLRAQQWEEANAGDVYGSELATSRREGMEAKITAEQATKRAVADEAATVEPLVPSRLK